MAGDGHRSVPLAALRRAIPVQAPGRFIVGRLEEVGADRMTEGRVVDLQRDIVTGLLTRALPPRTDFRPVIVGAEMAAEVRCALGVGIVRRYAHHFGIDGNGAAAPRVAHRGAAELTDP